MDGPIALISTVLKTICLLLLLKVTFCGICRYSAIAANSQIHPRVHVLDSDFFILHPVQIAARSALKQDTL